MHYETESHRDRWCCTEEEIAAARDEVAKNTGW